MNKNLTEKILDVLSKISIISWLLFFIILMLGVILRGQDGINILEIMLVYVSIVMFLSTTLLLIITSITWLISKIGLFILQKDAYSIISMPLGYGSNIEQIIIASEKISSHSNLIYLGKKLGEMNPFSYYQKYINRRYVEESGKIIQTLEEIKLLLKVEIDTIKSHLESAQIELSSLEGNESLLGLKLQQSTRIDKQIAQFEELQRVLVQV